LSDFVGLMRPIRPLNKNTSSTLRTKRTPRYHLNSTRNRAALCSRLTSACAVTGTPVLVYSTKNLSSTTFPGDIQRWGTEGASSQRPLLLYQPCQSLTPPGVSFVDYTVLGGESQAISRFIRLAFFVDIQISFTMKRWKKGKEETEIHLDNKQPHQ